MPNAPELRTMESRWPALQYELLQLSWWSEEHADATTLDMRALEPLMVEELERIELLGIRRAFLREARSALRSRKELTDLVGWCLNKVVSDDEAAELVRRFADIVQRSKPWWRFW